ncbi:MAG: hypothetical protein QOE14_956 [Humisphaera sp.]|nr:hypothetical protein [Humisphaera sp.]
MALPPKGDPRRPLHLAVHSLRLLGGVWILFSTCAMSPFFLFRGRGSALSVSALIYLLPVFLFYVAPGASFIVLSVFVARKRAWAVIVSICLASLACLVALLGLAGIAYWLTSATFQPPMLFPLGLALLMVFAFAQLIYHLAKSFEVIRDAPPNERGFEPIMVPPAPVAEIFQHDQRDDRPPPPASAV